MQLTADGIFRISVGSSVPERYAKGQNGSDESWHLPAAAADAAAVL